MNRGIGLLANDGYAYKILVAARLFYDNIVDLTTVDNVVTIIITGDATIGATSSTILCDASVGDVTLTMPVVADSIPDGTSIAIGVTKTDTTNNLVTMITSDGALIVGAASQFLNWHGEVLNFITDGTNWYLGS